MIYATVNMTIGDYSSTCDNKILLYRGDKNVEIRIVMKGNKFTVLDSTYAQMIIRRPSATSVFSEPAPIQNDTVIFVITEDMIDELKEIGEYTFQIRLYDDTMTARATLPPCKSALIIERPIAVEGEAAVNLAMVNDSAVMPAADIDEEEIFTEDNKYNRTIWVDGDLITDVRLNKIEEALYYINENSGNGGGGSATAPYISTELPETVMVGSDENFDLNLFFNSPNMGKGTLRVFINDVDAMSIKIDQGDSTTVIPNNLFAKGTNRVVVYVLDRVGVMSNSLVFYIRYGSTEISSDFDPYSAYDYGSTIRYYFTPTALDTSLSLTFYMSIDGQVQQGVNCTSDTRGYYTFPTNLSPDSHYCEAYVIDSKGVKSNVLSFNLIILDDNALVVASDTKEVSVEEGEQVSLDYKVYMKYNTSFIANIYVDDALVNTGTCNADFNYYKTSSLTKGVHTVKLEVFDVTETHSDYITWTVVVSESTYEMLQPVNAGAMFIGTALNKTNTDERKQYFIGHDQEGYEVLGTLSNFAYNSESGWVNDELIISGNSHVEIPIQPLANNAKYGFTLDIEFTSKQIGVPDAEVLTLWNDETNCGIKITTEKLILQSSNGNKCDLYFTDNEKTHVMFVIDRQELKAKIYLNGVMCEAFHLNDYTVDGVAYLDDFTVNSNIILGGLNTNGYCKIRNLRVYQVALTTDEIMNNFISCEIDKAKQRELSEFQKGNDLPTLYVYCDFSGLGKDDKKPCKIVYNSTNEELYGKSFNLDHKQSLLQYQGTSSMAYPIKNYRLNLRDENGDKWYYTLPTAQPECRFTLKADFMSSGHWTNTGMAKFINDKLYNYDVNDEKSMNPFKWDHVQNGGKVTDFRETISGFPCRLILVNDGETPLNTGQNEPTPGNTKDMGIFNFNNDKDNVTTLGFNSDIFPNCASYEVTANSDTSAGAFMSYKPEPIGLKSGNFHNTSFIEWTHLGLKSGDTITITSDKSFITFYQLPQAGWSNSLKETVSSKTYSFTLSDKYPFLNIEWYKQYKPSYIIINDIKYGFIEVDTITTYGEGVKSELAYLKESFELRHPDADDVPEDWGFMGVGDPIPKVNYWTQDGLNYYTAKISLENLGTRTISVYFSEYIGNVEVYVYNYSAMYTRVHHINKSTPITFEDTDYYFAIKLRKDSIDNKGLITINDVQYEFGDSMEFTDDKSVIQNLKLDTASGLKALIDWVDNCTDEEFVRDFEEHFHKDYTLRYFCLVTLIGAVDNLGKNMMLDTADNKIFFPRFYDIDTICSYDNSGQLKFDVDIEMEQGYWNTSSSRLWTRIRDLMHDDIVTTYNDMRQNGVSYENMMHYIYDEQIAKIPQTYYNKDYDVKYAPFADSYIGMAHGDTYEHVKRWLKQRFAFVDTLFDYAPSYNNDILTIRVNTTEEITLHLETYTPVYQHLSWYNGQMDKKKIDGKTSITFSGKVQAATDQEVLIYGGSNIKKITGIQSGNPNRLILGSATKLTELDASNCPLLAEINMNKANLSPHEYLNKVNLSNCPLLEGNLRLNNSPLIQEIDISGTGITGMNLPSSIRNLQVLRLPNTMTELTLNDAGMLHTLEFDEGAALQSISMTNCNALTNVVNFDLLQTPSITLNNSYNSVAELYFRDTSNLVLSNMPNLERVIFTPNNEYETFEMINVANAPDYKITTFNCPKLSTFMTTAPYRESYMVDVEYTTEYVGQKRTILEHIQTDGTQYFTTDYIPNANTVVKADMHMTRETQYDYFFGGNSFKLQLINDSGNISVAGMTLEPDAKLNGTLAVTRQTWIAKSTLVDGDTQPLCIFCGFYKDALETHFKGIGKLYSFKIYENEVLLHDYEPCLDNNGVVCLYDKVVNNFLYASSGVLIPGNIVKVIDNEYVEVAHREHGDIQPNTTFTANSIDISSTQFTDVKLLCTTDTNTLKLPTTVKNFYCDSSFDLDTDYLEDGEYDVVHGELVEPYTTDYEGEVILTKNGTFEVEITDWKKGYKCHAVNNVLQENSTYQCMEHYIQVVPGSTVYLINHTATTVGLYEYVNTNDTLVRYTSSQLISHGYRVLQADTNYIRIDANMDAEVTIKYDGVNMYTPNLIPSSADGSLIFSMYAPSNAVAPASGTWDLHGLEFDNFHTFGMNNDVKVIAEKTQNINFNEVIELGKVEFDLNIELRTSANDNRGYIQLRDGYKTRVIYFNRKSIAYATNIGSWVFTKLKENTSSSATKLKLSVREGVLTYYLDGESFYSTNLNNIPYYDDTIYNQISIELINDGGFDSIISSKTLIMSSNDINDGIKSLSMPARYDDYNITIKNANISPKTHNTMLYPLLVNEDNPITGTLDYTDYAGKHLSWSFAYTDEEYVDIIQPKDELLNSYEYRYNAFYDTEYEFENPYEIARYTSSASGVLPGFNAEFTYTYDEKDNGDGTYTTKIYTDSLDNLPTSISFRGKTTLLTVSKLNISKLTRLTDIFFECKNLIIVECAKDWDTSNITNFNSAFYQCSKLAELDVSNWNVDNSTSFWRTFYGCGSLTTLDLSNWNTSKADNMSNMFRGCSGLTSLDLSGFDTSNVTNMAGMFQGCSGLTSLDVSGFDTKNVTDMNNMFFACGVLSLDVKDWNVEKVNNMYSIFSYMPNITSMDINGWVTTSLVNASEMFHGSEKLTTVDATGLTFADNSNIDRMFYNCYGLTEVIGIETWDVSKVFSMNSTFRMNNNNDKLTSLNLASWDVANVIYMPSMFAGCRGLTSLDVSGFDTKNVTDMNNMFYGCSGLTSLDLSGFDTSNVTNMQYVFNKCENLERLKGNFVLNNVDCSYMFQYCLKAPDLSEFKMSGTVRGANYMFNAFGYNNTPLATSLDLSDIALAEGCEIVQYTFFRCTVKDIYPFTNINSNCHLSNITLSQEVILRFINNLVEVTTSPTLTLGATNLAKLTEDQIAIATNKGWTVV